MLKSKRERLIDEICDNAQLQDYRATLTQLVAMIEDDWCKVYADYSRKASSYNVTIDEAPIIRISLLVVKEPINVIWRLLHEYGHHLSGPRYPADTKIFREELAWKYAEPLLEKYPELLKRKVEFDQCRDHDLGTYYKKYSN